MALAPDEPEHPRVAGPDGDLRVVTGMLSLVIWCCELRWCASRGRHSGSGWWCASTRGPGGGSRLQRRWRRRRIRWTRPQASSRIASSSTTTPAGAAPSGYWEQSLWFLPPEVANAAYAEQAEDVTARAYRRG